MTTFESLFKDATADSGSSRDSPASSVAREKVDEIIPVDGTDGTISEAGGNTKLQPRSKYAKKWCFTWNNYDKTNEWEKLLKDRIGSVGTDFIIIGKEVGSSGTKHLQGYIEFINRTRPIETLGIKAIHWEVAKGNREQNYIYCSKDNDIVFEKGTEDIKAAVRRKTIKIIDNLRPWQIKIVNTYLEHLANPNDRVIYWVYDKKGNNGKSALAKFMVVKYKCGYLSNAKTADIACYCAKNICDGYVMDFSRSFQDKINYGAIENLKNGLLFSSKYESGLVCMNSPFIICFSNELPNYEKMSKDRWRILNIEEEALRWKEINENEEKILEYTMDDLDEDGIPGNPDTTT